MHTNKGFTLIEMMIVFAIIGILATIAFDALEKRKMRGESTQQEHTIEYTGAAQ